MSAHRFSQDALSMHFLHVLNGSVLEHGDPSSKPLEVDLRPPLPHRIRLYLYNATSPPGGRTLGECKAQLIVPGQEPGQPGNFDFSDQRVAVLAGYNAVHDVFVLWDAGLHSDFAYSKNVQVKPETLYAAAAGRLATQDRRLRAPSGTVTETVVAARSAKLREALRLRADLSRERLLRPA